MKRVNRTQQTLRLKHSVQTLGPQAIVTSQLVFHRTLPLRGLKGGWD